MNKSTIAVIGFLAGVAAGAVGSYFFTKKKVENEMYQEIEELSARYREKVRKLTGEDSEEETEETSDDEEDHSEFENPEQDKIDNNEGVKMYHRPVNKDSLNTTYKNALEEIKKEARDMSENERAAELDPSMDPIPGIVEIDEDEFTTGQGNQKMHLQYFCTDDRLRLLNHDGTTGDDADVYFRQEFHADLREEVTGKFLRWAPDYIPDGEDVGNLYLRNLNLKLDLDIQILNDMFEQDFTEMEILEEEEE